MKKSDVGITVSKSEDIAQWYEQVCIKGEVADFGAVKGTIVIRPRGFYIWQAIQDYFNKQIEEIGVDNCYFPLFIPESYFVREAEHAEGFAPELAWVGTKNDDIGEKAIIRPTSETIIAENFKKWLRNYRQLPIKVNQWCNVVRWEVKQTKLFLRGREFLWQEGHCIYETKEECVADVQKILDAYVTLCKDVLAIPLLAGKKSKAETFAGADFTLAIEALMPDGKALQMGTSHYLGQGFMKAFDVQFMGRDEQQHYPHYNSWGVSTRMLGAVIMSHSDDKGLVLPPKLVKQKVVIVPVKPTTDALKYCDELKEELSEFGAFVDDREGYSLGWKLSEWELKGTPFYVIVGPKEMEQGMVTVTCRDQTDKTPLPKGDLKAFVAQEMDEMHHRLYAARQKQLDESIVDVSSFDELLTVVKEGKLARAPFFDDADNEQALETESQGICTRIITELDAEQKCIFSGKLTKTQAIFGRSY